MKYLITALCLLFGITANSQDVYQKIIDEMFESEGTGVTAIVAKGGKVIYTGAKGHANLELDVDMRVDNILRLGSITKQFTAVAIMMLHEDGKLEVSDPITKYLPDYPVGEHTITVEHLLTHTSGIQSYTDMPGFMQNETGADKTVNELIDVFKDEPMQFDPGDEWRYNNSGYILLGAIIEAADGRTYEDYIENEIFKPLGMTASYYDNNGEIVALRSAGYDGAGDGSITNAKYLSMTLPYAAGSLMSTVEDLLKWNTAVMNGEVISEASMEKVFKGYVLNDGSDSGYGYGWQLGKIGGLATYSHGGGIFGFLTQGIYIPSQDVYAAVLSNCTCKDPGAAARRMAAHAAGVSLEFTAIEIDESTMEQYVGVYAIEDTDEKRTISVGNGKLYSQRGSGSKFEIKPYAEDKFYYESRTTIEFVRDSDGAITSHQVTQANGNSSMAMLTDEKVEVKKTVTVDKAILENYVGVYELMQGFDIAITVNGDALSAQATGQGALLLEAYSDREFGYPAAGINIEFPEAQGKTSDFVLNQGGQSMTAKRKD